MDNSRTFELRTYHTNPGKLVDLHARFRDHTRALFEKHGITNVGYFTPSDGEAAENTLVYLLSYPSRDAATASWEAFKADPDWIAAKSASEANGPIVERIESVYLDPTDYSALS